MMDTTDELTGGTNQEETSEPTTIELAEESAIEAALHSSTEEPEQEILGGASVQQPIQHTITVLAFQQQEAIRTQLEEQQNLKVEMNEDARQAAEQERIRKETEEARLATLRLQQEQEAQRAILLQQQATVRQLQEEQERQRAAETQATEDRREAEAAFAASCSTGAPALEEHYRRVNSSIARLGF